MKLIVLWSSLSDYFIASLRALSEKDDVKIFLIYQSVKTEAPFSGFDLSFCVGHFEDHGSDYKLLEERALQFDPEIVLMASWNFKHYMSLSRLFRKKGIPVIAAFDNQWKGTLRQNVARIISSLYLKPVITNFFVPGDRQAQFAYRLGYKNPIQGFYCANSSNFEGYRANINMHRFIFVGRFVEDKGIRLLIDAYSTYRKNVKNPWTLLMVGEGPQKYLCEGIEGVELRQFVQPAKLPAILSEASCFILPSINENWGLVIHEASLVGLPIICSKNCGASVWFLRDGQNGFVINPDEVSILNSLLKIHYLSDHNLKEMSDQSLILGNLWTTQRWADQLYSNLKSIVDESTQCHSLIR